MKTAEIGSLAQGIIAVIGIALALGQYGKLERWARMQAAEALAWKRPLPYFFAPVIGCGHKSKGAVSGPRLAHRP